MNNAELKRTNKPRKRRGRISIHAKAVRKRQNYLKWKKAKELKARLYCNVCNIQYENEKDLRHCVQNDPPPKKGEVEIKSEVPSEDEEVEEIKVIDPLSIDPLQTENSNFSERNDLQIQPPLCTDTSDLQNHEQPFQCTQYNKTYEARKNLLLLLKYNSQTAPDCNLIQCKHVEGQLKHYIPLENPYKCTQCDKTYKNRKSFENHMNIHKPINPFTCPYCFKPFSTESSLMSHKQLYCRKHKFEEQGLDFSDDSICFDTEEVVDEQVENIHLEQSPKFIEETHKEDYNEEDLQTLNTYKLKKLPTAEYKCTTCEEQFSVACLLKRHCQSHDN